MQPANVSPAVKCQKCGGGELNKLSEKVRAAAGFLSAGDMQTIRTFECRDCGAVFTKIEQARQ